MINLITMNKDKQKTARPVRNRKEYVALRNIATNVKNFELAGIHLLARHRLWR